MAFRSDFDDLIEAALVISSGEISYILWNNEGPCSGRGNVVQTRPLRRRTPQSRYTHVCGEDLTTHDLLKHRPHHLLDTSATAWIGPFTAGADFLFGGVPCTATVNMNNTFQPNNVELIGNMMPPRTFVLDFEVHSRQIVPPGSLC